ncbi:MAG: helix-turn-helix transcriptional regulator [Treponema sp.]|nr:helix-turn-helix transcriptional regulator [Treponema sp.]
MLNEIVCRENKGWTQKELSERTGIAIPNISLMEAGKRPIGARTAKKLAEALGCDAGDFI